MKTPPFEKSSRVFALVDCNNFFVSCERVFRPDLQNKPVIVLSNNDGCIISRSNEAKALGIPMGKPIHEYRDLVCRHQVTLFSPNFSLYGHFSDRVMRILRQWTEQLEIYSIDEAFLDLTDYPVSELTQTGRAIQRQIFQYTGIPVSVGIAETKTLSKIAAETAKKSAKAKGVLNLTHSPYQTLALSRMGVQDVWGIGGQLSERLREAGIHTALALRDAYPDFLKQRLRQAFSIVFLRTLYELQGISCVSLHTMAEARKSIISSRSFGQPVTSLSALQQAVATYTARAGEKVRQDNLAAGSLIVTVRTNRFHPEEAQYKNSALRVLPVPTQATAELIRYAHQALNDVYRPGYIYHKACITLLNLAPASQIQGYLFDTDQPVRERWQNILPVVDYLNQYYGSGTLCHAAEGLRAQKSQWKSRRQKVSPRYVSCWKELPAVRAV